MSRIVEMTSQEVVRFDEKIPAQVHGPVAVHFFGRNFSEERTEKMGERNRSTDAVIAAKDSGT